MNLGAYHDDEWHLPAGWIVIEQRIDGLAAQRIGLRLFISIAIERDAQPWMHFSISRVDRIPSWRDLRDAKTAWLGDREAYMVFPSSERYVNIHPNVLHLWSPVNVPSGLLPHFEGVMTDGQVTI